MRELPTTAERTTSPAADDDRAWVIIDTPLAPADLRVFLDDVERLFRINPLLVFELFEKVATDCFRVRVKNLSNGLDIETQLRASSNEDSVFVAYEGGLKAATTFRVEASDTASRLVVTDIYRTLPEAEKRSRVAEVDSSLNAWGKALHGYLRHWARLHHLTPWRWYMARVWQPMTPSARRIVFLILAISMFEIATVAVVFLALFLMA